MTEVSEALSMVLAKARPKSAVGTPVPEALGLVLAEDIASDIDSPPHDKSLVDGYAIVAADAGTLPCELDVLEEVTAGAIPTKDVAQGTATRIMTGAPIPAGADAVVMVEQTELRESARGERVRIGSTAGSAPICRGQNIMRRATSLAQGQVVLRSGHPIRSIEIGLLSEVGRHEVSVIGRPSLSVIATGSELVPADRLPNVGQIRNSNGPMLSALARRAGAGVTDLGIARDDRSHLRQLIQQGLEHDVLVLSGGVSAGVLDLVPGVLEELDVKQVFHKINLKPGKPLWFGVLRGAGRDVLVFGLPGNPVSSLVCFELFVRPALNALAGRSPTGLARCDARLTRDHQQRGNRPTYWPARLDGHDGDETVEPLDWRGSADLRTLAEANGFAYFPAGDRQFSAGERIAAFRIDG